MNIIILLSLLQLKHWYADFKIQTYEQTIRKGIWGDFIGIMHSVEHVIGTLLVLTMYSALWPITITYVLGLSILDGLIHYHIDWIKVKFGTKDSKTPEFWSQFGLDQLAHHLTYIGIAVFLL